MWVAKIGGSLHAHPRLAARLAALRDDRAQRWLLVPGGGPHADLVRDEQRRLGYDDAEAHRRAILAMARYGEDLLEKCPGFVRADSIGACAAHAASGLAEACVWCPAAADVAALASLPADWRVSSDSIAHALASRLGATALLLVKSVPPPAAAGAAALAAAGWIDAWLPRLMMDSSLPVYWCAADALDIPGETGQWPIRNGPLDP